MNIKIRMIAIIVCALMPVLLAFNLYNAFDCTSLTDKNYQAWLAQGNKGTVNDMTKSCNILHPIVLAVLLPTSPIIGFVTYLMTKPENFSTNSKSSNQEDK